MKRAILIEVLLFFAFAVTIFFCGWFFKWSVENFRYINIESQHSYALEWGLKYLIFGLLALFAAIGNIVAMVLIALKEFPVFKPLIEKRRARKAERQEANKQARIEALEAELDELKKNE